VNTQTPDSALYAEIIADLQINRMNYESVNPDYIEVHDGNNTACDTLGNLERITEDLSLNSEGTGEVFGGCTI